MVRMRAGSSCSWPTHVGLVRLDHLVRIICILQGLPGTYPVSICPSPSFVPLKPLFFFFFFSLCLHPRTCPTPLLCFIIISHLIHHQPLLFIPLISLRVPFQNNFVSAWLRAFNGSQSRRSSAPCPKDLSLIDGPVGLKS